MKSLPSSNEHAYAADFVLWTVFFILLSSGAGVFALALPFCFYLFRALKRDPQVIHQREQWKRDDMLRREKEVTSDAAQRRADILNEIEHQRKLELKKLDASKPERQTATPEEAFVEAHRRYVANCEKILASELDNDAKAGLLRDEKLELERKIRDKVLL